MKCFLCCVLLAAVVCAEPPRYRSVRFQRQEAKGGENSEREPTTPRAGEAPYPAAGWRPAKEFGLPSRQEAGPPATSYGTPLDSYAAPQSEYGVPTEAGAESTTAGGEGSGDEESLKVRGLNRGEKSARQTAESEDVQSNVGAYYVLLPNSRLQRVDFRTENDLRNMAYTARLQYRAEDQAPIYVYTGANAASPQVSAAYAVPQVSAAYAVPVSVPRNAAYIQYV